MAKIKTVYPPVPRPVPVTILLDTETFDLLEAGREVARMSRAAFVRNLLLKHVKKGGKNE